MKEVEDHEPKEMNSHHEPAGAVVTAVESKDELMGDYEKHCGEAPLDGPK